MSKIDAVIKLFHSLGRKIAAKKSGKIPTTLNAESEAAGMYTTLTEAGLKPEDMHKFIKSEKDIIKYLNQIEAIDKQRTTQETLASGLGKYFKKEGEVIQFPRDRITDWRKKGPGEGKVSELQSGIMKATESKPTVVKTEAQIKSKLEAGNKAAVQKMKIDKLRKDVLKEIENRKNEDYIGNIIDPEDYGFRVSDGTLTDEVEEIMEMLIRDKKAYGGLAGMLGERTGYKDAKFVGDPTNKSPYNIFQVGFGPILDDFFEEGPNFSISEKDLEDIKDSPKQDIEDIMFRIFREDPEKFSKIFLEVGKDKAGIGWKKQFAGGGLAPMLGEPTYMDENHRVPYNIGGSISDVLPADFDELEPEHMDLILKLLKAGEIPQYAGGGRVPLSKGKVVKGLAALMEKLFPGTTKLGKTSKPMAEKTQLKKAIADFQEREKNKILDVDEHGSAMAEWARKNDPEGYAKIQKVVDDLNQKIELKRAKRQSPWFKNPKTLTPEEELRREFPGISDDLIKNILADDNPQRIAEVKAAMKEALKMQEKGMGVEEIINIFKKKPTKHATGGRVSLSSGGVAGMLGE